MIVQSPLRHAARVEMHLPGGFTRVILFKFGDRRLELPTGRIPLPLRRIGSEFFVITPRFTVETSDSPETVREQCQQVHIEELHKAAPADFE
jgi:hypothetical protein